MPDLKLSAIIRSLEYCGIKGHRELNGIEITQAPKGTKECTAEEIFPNAPRKKKNLG